MRFSYWIPNTLSWEETVASGRSAADLGFSTLWVADHFMPNAGKPADGPVHEVFTVLAGLGACIPDVRLGTMVVGNTYRNPAVMAKTAATLDMISGGRFTLGLGAGWQENEHSAYGIDFGTIASRFERLEETCQALASLFSQQRTTFDGVHVQLIDAPLDPKPVQKPLPLLIGGGGEKRTLRITAKYANQWNVWGTPDVLAHKIAVLRQHCADIGRDSDEIHKTAVALLFLVDDDAAADKIRALSIERPTVIGTAAQVIDQMHEYTAAGVSEFIVPGFTFRSAADRDATLARLMAEVAPHC